MRGNMKTGTKVKDYLNYFREENFPEFFSGKCIKELANIEGIYGETESEETILEVVLNREERGCDYSIRIDTEDETVREYWYEMDYGSYGEREIVPCLFIDASAVRPGEDNSAFYENILPKLAGEERAKKLRPMLERCVDRLTGRCETLFQLGVMRGRKQEDSIRLFTEDMKKETLVSYLQDLHWEGDTDRLAGLLAKLEPYSNKEMFILDFDVFSDRISGKIGINLGTEDKKPETVSAWLDFLSEEGLCLPAKRQDVLKWVKTFPAHSPFMMNDISHFKLPFQGEQVLAAKAYLRQGSHLMSEDFRAYSAPVLMNLELTDKCPLRCPQCYCDLTTGKELSLEKALYWIGEAAANGVKIINLSGGETMCYPHLTTLLRACRDYGLEPNIAVSGYGLTKEKLQELIESGAADICVSLNGSTEEINSKTRDGYELAIRTLQLLKELNYPRICINWVMHACNAEDFPQMIRLAQEYGVRELVVMVFKPDASHQLPGVPNEAQLRSVAAQIKAYKGPVHIVAEECFSQMKALLGERFFTNINRGIGRGCGAGRDGVSVNVDGKLTPCRHLEFPEETLSLKKYWNESSVLQTLREVEDEKKSPCSICKYQVNCLPCMAVSVKLNGEIAMGGTKCALKDKTELKTDIQPQSEEEKNAMILTNLKDEDCGTEEKLATHQKGLLHKAFSVLLYHDNKVLIQKRAAGKYHSAGLWANTCCSHPRRGEELIASAKKRLSEEAGISCEVDIGEIGSFVYRAVFDNGLVEYEYDHVLAGEYDGEFVCNPKEAEEMKYVEIDWLAKDMQENPERYAPWFLNVFTLFMQYMEKEVKHDAH